jgi:hypothetical protein
MERRRSLTDTESFRVPIGCGKQLPKSDTLFAVYVVSVSEWRKIRLFEKLVTPPENPLYFCTFLV